MCAYLCLTQLALLTGCLLAHEVPVVTIHQGTLVGQYQYSFNGRKFSAFTGIPYAKPPVGKLRFKLAEPADPWHGILDATKPHPICTQIMAMLNDFNPKGEEDCLYLNVYTPQINEKKLPVLFYIHYGGFMWGNANYDLHGPNLFMDKDIVVVSVNYRLGPFGFLSTGDETVPGNNGLKDQLLALKWTRRNIEAFGGDANEITIFGQSAGGISSHYHMLSPLSRGLFKRIISNSGLAVGPYSLSTNSENQNISQKLAQIFNCPTQSSVEMVECLQNVDAFSLASAERKLYYWAFVPTIIFKPVIEPNVEGAFITEHPHETIKSGKLANVPFLVGSTKDDGALVSAGVHITSGLSKEFYNRFDDIVPKLFYYDYPPHDVETITTKIREFYFSKEGITRSTLSKASTDNWFLIPAMLAVKLHTKHYTAPVYFYSFEYRGSKSFSELYENDVDYGVCHCDDLFYLLQTNVLGHYDPSQSDRNMIKVMVDMWINFAITGNPTPPQNAETSVRWTPATEDRMECLVIKNASDINIEVDLFKERFDFWNDVTPLLDNRSIREDL